MLPLPPILFKFLIKSVIFVQAATQKMVRQRRPGKLVFISSTLGYMSFVGYNSYSPGKHALRGEYLTRMDSLPKSDMLLISQLSGMA
jgi:NADP-dependent 3-hydroxy acid dehydrogenase YdfG